MREKAESIQLSIKIKSLERELEGFLSRFSSQGIATDQYLSNLGDCSDILRNSVVDDEFELDRKLAELKLSIQRLRLMVQNPTSSAGRDYLNKVKCLMELIESKILLFKAQQIERINELEQSERSCYHEIKMIEERISKADYTQDFSLQPRTASSSNPFVHDTHFFDRNASGLLPAVIEFQRYVSKYGHTNGWDPINHAGFIKLRKKYGAGTEALFKASQERLLHITLDMAMDHDEWYTLYEEKAAANKEAIQKWKSKRMESAVAIKSLVEEDKVEPAQQEQLKKGDQSQESLKIQKLREFKKFELALWKKEQAKQKKLKEEKEEEERIQNAENLKKKALERKKKREMKLQQQSEAQKQQETVIVSEKMNERKTSNILVLALQKEREDQVLKKRQDLIKKKKMQDIEKEHRLEKLKNTVRITAERDPERLLKPTKGFMQKSLSDETLIQESSKTNSLANLQRRAVPLWRSELQ